VRNAVFALGDTFLEVISPAKAGTAAGRHLERRGGDGGYMVIFQLDDLDAARARVEEMGIRVVWRVDLPDISGTHLHPVDVGGAIVSLDRADPPASWRWGGPEWTGRAGQGAPGRLAGATISVKDPQSVARRWSAVLGVPLAGDGGRPELRLDRDVRVAFEATGSAEAAGAAGAGDAGTAAVGLTEVEVALPPSVRRGRDAVDVGGVCFRMTDDGS
jgi:catechol 2,3-dioxygenase-like lactoylglutathione lyase family enzyme